MSEDIEKLKKEAKAKYEKVATVLKELQAAKTKKAELVTAAEKMKTELEKLPE